MPATNRRDDADRTGFDDTRNYLGAAVGRILPATLAHWAVTVSVTTDATTYAVGESVEITVQLRNRLPVPVEVITRTRRPWGWRVDGILEASDERRYVRAAPTTIGFRAGETKRATVRWDGRIRRVNENGLDRSIPADPGEHVIAAFLPVEDPTPQHEAETRIRIR